jgi:hypothetical protein
MRIPFTEHRGAGYSAREPAFSGLRRLKGGCSQDWLPHAGWSLAF